MNRARVRVYLPAGVREEQVADIRQVTDGFGVAPQLAPGDMAEAARLGYRIVIGNRPDGEAPGQMDAAAVQEEARSAGLAFVHAPFQGQPTPAAIEALTQAMGANQGPVLAYCRSGTRSVTAWAMAAAQNRWASPDEIVQAARKAGYMLDSLKGLLRNLASR